MSTDDPVRIELSGTRIQLMASSISPAASPTTTARDSLRCAFSSCNCSRKNEILGKQNKPTMIVGINQAIELKMVELSSTEESIDSRVPSARPSPVTAYLLRMFICGISRSKRAPVAIWTKITADAKRIDTFSLTVPEVVLDAQSRGCWRVLLQRIRVLRSHRDA